MILKINELNKKFYTKEVLTDINLALEAGRIYGLLGPNGSGKTTLMRIVANIIKNTTGKVRVNNLSLGKETKKIVAFMPTSNFFPSWMKIKDTVDYFCDFYEDFNKEMCYEILQRESLDLSLKIKDLSTGMTEKLKIALTISRNAKLILLDEPFNGIDIIAKESIKKMIVQASNRENAILISSHLIDDMESLLDDVILLKEGRIVLNSPAEVLRDERGLSIKDAYKEVF